MAVEYQRLRRLITQENGSCCDADIHDRLESLESLQNSVPPDADRDLTVMKTLGDDTRYRIIRLLVATDGALCVCEITPLIDVSDSAVSHALSDLTDAGLVHREKRGTWRYYRATERATAIVTALDSTRGEP